MLYIQINETNKQVIGYSSSQITENDIIVDEGKLSEDFLSMPIFYNYIDDKFVYDKKRYNDFMLTQENQLTNEQKLGQQISNLEIQVLMLQKILNNKMK